MGSFRNPVSNFQVREKSLSQMYIRDFMRWALSYVFEVKERTFSKSSSTDVWRCKEKYAVAPEILFEDVQELSICDPGDSY